MFISEYISNKYALAKQVSSVQILSKQSLLDTQIIIYKPHVKVAKELTFLL